MTRPASRSLRLLVLALFAALTLGGCGFNVYNLPLPGGPNVGSNPIHLKIQFQDALDLVPQSTVKSEDVTVGKVNSVTLEGDHALVDVTVRRDANIPANATASIRQTSLLGEKFVSLDPPLTGAPTGRIADGTEIPLARTGRNPEIEEVLGALSLLLNGGGVGQLKTISHELSLALDGHESAARDVLTQISTLMGQLDQHKADIVHAIDSINQLAISINKQTPVIDSALQQLPSALDSLNAQRGDLVKMLSALERLSNVGVRVIKASKTSTIDALTQLDPVLTGLARSGDNFAKSFSVFLTYPFVDETVGRNPQVARNLQMGDYTNLSVQLDISLQGQQPSGPSNPLTSILPPLPNPTQLISDLVKCLQSRDITSKACRKILNDPGGLKKLQKECQKPQYQDNPVCKAVTPLPGTTALPSLTGLPSVSIPGLPRAPVAAPVPQHFGVRGPTYGQLMTMYDPALVSLLVPGMVVNR